jgi:hypothetical protein
MERTATGKRARRDEMTLYDLSEEMKRLAEEIEQNDGVIEGDLEKRLDTLPMDFQAKGLNVGLWIKNLKAFHDATKGEVEKLRNKLKTAQAVEEQARQYLFDCMMKAGVEKIKHPQFSAWIQSGSKRVDEDVDVDMLPAEFKETEITITPKKKEILDHYKKTGEVVPGAKIVDGSPFLVIR